MITPATMVIREASASDADALADQRAALFEELGQLASGDAPDPFRHHSAHAFRQGLDDGTCYAWVAISAGAVVASTALLVFPRLPTPASLATQEGYLLNVYTEPSHREKGLATSLVATAINKARALGLARIRLHATAKGALVYAAAGFLGRTDEMELKLE